MSEAPRKLTLGRILLYSAASAGLNIMSITVSTWILYFYAPPPDSGRIQYLPAALVGILLTGGLWHDRPDRRGSPAPSLPSGRG
jgi:GPH family glycoside/pentoside/hexuronide:cation symporter